MHLIFLVAYYRFYPLISKNNEEKQASLSELFQLYGGGKQIFPQQVLTRLDDDEIEPKNVVKFASDLGIDIQKDIVFSFSPIITPTLIAGSIARRLEAE